MIPAQHPDHGNPVHGNRKGRFGRFTACLIGGILIFLMPINTAVQADEPLAVKKRTDQRSKDEKTKPRSRRKHRSRRGGQTPTADDSGIRLHLHGTFELHLGSGNIIRGEGSTSVELDPELIEKLLDSAAKTAENGSSTPSDWTQMVLALPKTVDATAEILNRISDPQTQANLRQVERLLRLLPQAQPDLTP